MMRKFFTILFLLITTACFGQSKDFQEIKLTPFSNKSTNLFGVLSFGRVNQMQTLFLSADTGTKKMSNVMVYPLKEKTNLVYLEGATSVSLSSTIPKDSLMNYRYTVINGDGLRLVERGLIPSLHKFDKTRAVFGTYKIPNQNLTVSVYMIGEPENSRELIIINKKLKPVELVEAKLTEVYKNQPIKIDTNEKGDTISTEKSISGATNLNIKGEKIPFNQNNSYAEICIKPIDFIFLYKIMIKREVGNEFFIDLLDDVNWTYDERSNLSTRLDKKYFEKPGKYEIIIYPKIGITDASKPESATSIKFEIGPPKFLSLKQVATLIAIVVGVLGGTAGLMIFYIKRKNKKKLMATQQQKAIVKSQLDSIRSQLNPHFMFNALAGIQSLMNKHKTEEANEYLGKFARITRNVLTNQELTSLAAEKTLLDDYLQMEQFRFGFSYQIAVEKELDVENTEIPSMLLQPFVENAVKHGIADDGAQGKITVFFKQWQNNLILEVTDNGKGFDVEEKYKGLGLQLSKDRIALLNSIYKETPFLLEMNANDKGTTIKLTLVNWL